MMKVSFIIVNYNRKDELLLTISKTKNLLVNSSFQGEIIIVDNASTDGSVDAVRDRFPDVALIANPVNIGAPAWNIGFEKATGEYFIILDDDSHLESGLDEALAYLDKRSEVGILALNIQGGAYRTNYWQNLHETAGFIGCGFILRKKVYQEIGGYADWIFLYTNESELSIRCLNAGYKIIFFEDCLVIHRVSGLHRTSKRLVVNSVRNEMAIVYKYFNKSTRHLYLTRVFLHNVKNVFRYGISSIPWYFTALKEFMKLRKQLAYTPVKTDVEKFFHKNIWWTKPFLGII